jgi:hypothetical protein
MPFTKHSDDRLMCARRLAAGAVAAMLMFVALGCTPPAASPEGPRKVAQDLPLNENHSEIEEQIREFVDYFQATVEHAAMELERKAASPDERRAAILFRVRLLGQAREAAAQADPKEAMLDLWALSQRMLDYFTTGAGKSAFGERQAVAADAARSIQNAIEALARRCVTEGSFEHVQQTVKAYAAEHPMQADFSHQPARDLSDEPRGEALQQLVGLPLAPLTALAGVGRTPDSIRSVSRSVERCADVAEDFPANARWELQLLGMNLAELPQVASTVASMERLSQSSTTLAASSAEIVRVAEQMPANLRGQAEKLLDRVDASQPELRGTLAEATRTVETVSQAGDRVRQSAAQISETVDHVREASQALEKTAYAVTQTAHEILKFVPATMKDADGQIIGDTSTAAATGSADDTSFSFQAVGRSAESLGETADKLRAFVADVRPLLDDGSVSREINTVIDRAAKRAAQLLILAVSLLAGYRILARRLARKSTPDLL